MSGIGFALHRMTQANSLSSVTVAYVCAAIIVAGPWIMTVIGINGISSIACDSACLSIQIFRTVIIYNSVFSLVLTTPIAFICTRFVSDQLYIERTQSVSFALFGALCVFFSMAAVVSIPFYAFATTLSPLVRVASVHNAMLIGGTWLLIPFLSALRDPTALLPGFALGVVAMIAAISLTPRTPFWLLTSFNLGLCVVDAIVLWRLSRAFGATLIPDGDLWRGVREYWELAVAGFAYGIGMWIDKLVMWRASPIGVLNVSGALQTMPRYDTPMFWAQLATLPAVAIFMMHVEPRFFQISRKVYDRIRDHACLDELESAISDLRKFTLQSLSQLFGAAASTSIFAIMLSFLIVDLVGLRANQMGIFRMALIGSAFHSCAMFCFILLLYLDLRMQALAISLVFLLLNFALTAAFLPLGVPFYGYGYMLASIITFAFSFLVLTREVGWVHFHVFITNNKSIRKL